VAEAARQLGAPSPIWAAQDARMGELYLARYAWADTPEGIVWQTLQAPALLEATAFAAQWRAAPAPIAGNGLLAHGAAFGVRAAGHETGHEVGPNAFCYPQAEPHGAALAALALAAWRRGEALDAAQAAPLYVRDKVAQTTAERAAARAAADAAPAAAAAR
jgi:tRNA threonylcarbamoyladenosine biosynthesis protein TsaB